MNSAAATVAVKSVGEVRPPRFVKYSVTSETEPELAESFGEDSSAAVRDSFFFVVTDAPVLVRFPCCHGATSPASQNQSKQIKIIHSAFFFFTDTKTFHVPLSKSNLIRIVFTLWNLPIFCCFAR